MSSQDRTFYLDEAIISHEPIRRRARAFNIRVLDKPDLLDIKPRSQRVIRPRLWFVIDLPPETSLNLM